MGDVRVPQTSNDRSTVGAIRVTTDRTKTSRATDTGTLPKGLKVLQAISSYPAGGRLTDIAREAGYPASTTHRVLGTLVAHGFVEYSADQRLYSLGLRIFELSHKVAQVKGMAEIALPILRELAAATDCNASLNILDEGQMLVMERADPSTTVQVRAQIGAREYVHSTATGKAVLASMPQGSLNEILNRLKLTAVTAKTIRARKQLRQELASVRERGFALSDEENELDLRSIAVAIPSPVSQRKAALSLAAPSFLRSIEELMQYEPMLRKAATHIGHLMVGHR